MSTVSPTRAVKCGRPPSGEWQTQSPPALGLTAAGIDAAIDYHRAHESTWRRDFLTAGGRYIGVADEPESPDDVLGPVRPRGGPNGLIVRAGVIVAEWGETTRADMTFSVAKSYLAALTGIAVGRGLIGSLDDPCARRRDAPSTPRRTVRSPGDTAHSDERVQARSGASRTHRSQSRLGKSELGASLKGTRE